jgi:hypothetical protein
MATENEYLNETDISKSLYEFKADIQAQSSDELDLELVWAQIGSIFYGGRAKKENAEEEFNQYKKHSTGNKIKNIKTVIELAEFLIGFNYYSMKFVTGFAHTIRLLNEYTNGDSEVDVVLTELKDVYIDYAKSYRKNFQKEFQDFGDEKVILQHVGEKILIDDEYLNGELKKIWSYGDSNGNSSDKRCFVATACYGHESAPEVVFLRNYRDNVLKKYLIGSLFIRIYYLISPILVKTIFKFPKIKDIFRQKVLVPLITKLKP